MNIGVLNEEKFDDRINRTAKLNEEPEIITRIQEEWLETRVRRRTTCSQNIDVKKLITYYIYKIENIL